jgi:hypothetical protein
MDEAIRPLGTHAHRRSGLVQAPAPPGAACTSPAPARPAWWAVGHAPGPTAAWCPGDRRARQAPLRRVRTGLHGRVDRAVGPPHRRPPGPRVFSRPRVHHDGVAGVAWNVPAVVVAPMRRRPRRGIGGPSRHAHARGLEPVGPGGVAGPCDAPSPQGFPSVAPAILPARALRTRAGCAAGWRPLRQHADGRQAGPAGLPQCPGLQPRPPGDDRLVIQTPPPPVPPPGGPPPHPTAPPGAMCAAPGGAPGPPPTPPCRPAREARVPQRTTWGSVGISEISSVGPGGATAPTHPPPSSAANSREGRCCG